MGAEAVITARERAERELAMLAERFLLASRATRDAIWEWDVVANTAWWSDAQYEELGYPRSTVPSFEAWHACVHPDDRDRVGASFKHALEGGGSTWNDEYRFLSPDGKARRMLDRAFIVRDANGKPVRMIGAMVDVTAQHELETKQRQAQKMEVLGQLAGGVAHDFNNILQAAIMQLALAAAAPEVRETTRADLRQVHETLHRAVSLTRQLLVFSRRETMQLRRVDLNSVLADLAKMLRRLLGEDITLRLELAPGSLDALADAGMLSQVIMNLAVNARQAMPRGGTLTIASSVVRRDKQDERAPGRYACITTTDTGTGISPDALPHIFEPFFTTKGPDEGTGLGLAIASDILRQHKGWIDVASEVDEGSTFRMYVPLEVASEDAANDELPRPSPRGRETILVVEDDAPIRQLTRRLLESHGYRVVDADDARSALRAWESERGRIDLVLTDVTMPGGMDGVELARELESRGSGLKVILATGYPRKITSEMLGPHRTLVHKPIMPEDLLTTVRARLDAE